MMASTCTGENCTYELSTAKAKSKNCDKCKQWYCMNCSKIPKKIFDALFAANKGKEDISMICFTCSSCKTASTTIRDLRNDLHTLKNDISKRIDDKTIEIKTHVDKKMVDFNVSHKQSFAEIVNKCKLPTVEKINSGVREAIDSSTIAAKEQELRDRSIMMFNRAESKAGNKKDRIVDDFDFITDFVKEGLHIQATSIESVDRIGRYEENKSRPIKILFNNKTDQTRVLRNLGNLKQEEKNLNKSLSLWTGMKSREKRSKS